MRSNIKMENQNITMVRGDTLSFNVEVFDENGDAITVDSADFTCKKLGSDESNVFHKSLNSGITQYDGYLAIRVAPEDTKEINVGQYFYDCQIGVDDDVFTILKGVLEIEQDVTY